MWVVFPIFPSVKIHSLQLWHANSNIFLFRFAFKKKDLHSFTGFKEKERRKGKKKKVEGPLNISSLKQSSCKTKQYKHKVN